MGSKNSSHPSTSNPMHGGGGVLEDFAVIKRGVDEIKKTTAELQQLSNELLLFYKSIHSNDFEHVHKLVNTFSAIAKSILKVRMITKEKVKKQEDIVERASLRNGEAGDNESRMRKQMLSGAVLMHAEREVDFHDVLATFEKIIREDVKYKLNLLLTIGRVEMSEEEMTKLMDEGCAHKCLVKTKKIFDSGGELCAHHFRGLWLAPNEIFWPPKIVILSTSSAGETPDIKF
jgi:hypothetical protein